jgi:hypothetical protein
VLLVVFVALLTVISALAGASYGHMFGGGMSVVMFLVWGFFGFLSAAVLAAFYFLLTEIAENTRRA